MQRAAAPSIPLLSANPRITPWQILSSNKGPLFAGGPHTWPELALLRNARNSIVCVSQRKLAAANYAPLTGSRRCNIKYESPQLYKAKRERPMPRDGGWRGQDGRKTCHVRQREKCRVRCKHIAHANRTFSMDFWTARKRSAARRKFDFLTCGISDRKTKQRINCRDCWSEDGVVN